jgi:DTW domain-containing protein YfiP
MEYKRVKAGTGRLTHLSLPNSELHVATDFDGNAPVQRLLADPARRVLLLYPGEPSLDPAAGDLPPDDPRELTILLLDATWSCARKMLRLSPSLQRLPRLRLGPVTPSRYLIKQQPAEGCLSTLEAVHETLLTLSAAGLDTYTQPTALLDLFAAMQARQLAFAADPTRPGYRRRPYTPPAERAPATGQSARRRNYLRLPPNPPPPAPPA